MPFLVLIYMPFYGFVRFIFFILNCVSFFEATDIYFVSGWRYSFGMDSIGRIFGEILIALPMMYFFTFFGTFGLAILQGAWSAERDGVLYFVRLLFGLMCFLAYPWLFIFLMFENGYAITALLVFAWCFYQTFIYDPFKNG